MQALLSADLKQASSRPANFHVIDRPVAADDYARALRDGMARSPHEIPCRFLYDDAGSRLFEAITELPEYYPTRTETALLAEHAGAIADLAGAGVEVVELGCGASRKVRLVLDALSAPLGYLGIDVSRTALVQACAALAGDYPGLNVRALVGDFTRLDHLPAAAGRRLAFFPGSTIGNFRPEQAVVLLGRWRELLAGGDMLVGVDLRKDTATLIAAYDDPAGVTAAFNLNLLARANREVGTDFDLKAFRHVALYDDTTGRVSLYIESLRRQTVNIRGAAFDLEPGERIHTEDSWKYTVTGFADLARQAGFAPTRSWIDPDRRFSLHYLRARL
jgi:dimethylhistidine N-methyltransferase